MKIVRGMRHRSAATPGTAMSVVLIAFLLLNCTLVAAQKPAFCPETSARNPPPVPAQRPQVVDDRAAARCTKRYQMNLNALEYITCMFPNAAFDKLPAAERTGIDEDGAKGSICASHNINGAATSCCFQVVDGTTVIATTGRQKMGYPGSGYRGGHRRYGRRMSKRQSAPTVKMVCVPDKPCVEELFPTCQKMLNFCSPQGPESSLSQDRCEKIRSVELCLSNTCYCDAESFCREIDRCLHPCSTPGNCRPPRVGIRQCCGLFNVSRRQCWWRRRNNMC